MEKSAQTFSIRFDVLLPPIISMNRRELGDSSTPESQNIAHPQQNNNGDGSILPGLQDIVPQQQYLQGHENLISTCMTQLNEIRQNHQTMTSTMLSFLNQCDNLIQNLQRIVSMYTPSLDQQDAYIQNQNDLQQNHVTQQSNLQHDLSRQPPTADKSRSVQKQPPTEDKSSSEPLLLDLNKAHRPNAENYYASLGVSVSQFDIDHMNSRRGTFLQYERAIKTTDAKNHGRQPQRTILEQPKPVQPTPVQPKPVPPKPVQSKPVKPKPIQPNPVPSKHAPSKHVPSNPVPPIPVPSIHIQVSPQPGDRLSSLKQKETLKHDTSKKTDKKDD